MPVINAARASELFAAAMLALLLSSAGNAQQRQSGLGRPAERIATHIETARQLAGDDVTAPFEFFCISGNARPNDPRAPALEPARLFDNLYVLGNSETVVYAITTSEGIVLIDSGFAEEVEPIVVPALLRLGLDPADVKIILLGHGHADHYGGASYFQSRFGARVGTTERDWETIARSVDDPRYDGSPIPAKDLIVRDGEAISLGATTITPVAIPGHTPGALAFVFEVYDAGERHVAGLFGGTVLASAWVPLPGLEQYVESIAGFVEV
ncbi:MAG TPA: MBL fold metallo-hydrolase, partial [Gammaproteobacteria bacterium]|nr:MBL fold metallo-hydrolase [Gammaproteobacteria bacterium]